MDNNVSNTLERLRDSSSKLNSLSDQLNSFVSRIESYLDECNVGLPVNVRIGGIEVSYCRFGQKFRFVISTNDTDAPWSDSPRELKLRTISVLPDLLNQLENSVKDKAEEVAKTLKILADMYPQLTQEKSGKQKAESPIFKGLENRKESSLGLSDVDEVAPHNSPRSKGLTLSLNPSTKSTKISELLNKEGK
ncbi:MAG: hypothetical protein AB7U82_35365 [Blastocatellales bacterium]